MRKQFKGKKGFTIVELIISVALLAIISVPLMAGFVNVARINKLARNQIEINAAAKQVQQEVIEQVKKGGIATDINGNVVNMKTNDVTNIKVGDGSTENSSFKYDSDYIGTTYIDPVSPVGGTSEYNITLYKKKGTEFKEVQKFKVYVSIS